MKKLQQFLKKWVAISDFFWKKIRTFLFLDDNDDEGYGDQSNDDRKVLCHFVLLILLYDILIKLEVI